MIAVLHMLVAFACATASSFQPSLEALDLGAGRLVQGAVVKENADSVFVDLGYTVLAVPRREIVARRASEEGEPATPVRDASASASELWVRGDSSERSVRECVERVGSSVVLVKVPGSLGSGFIVHRDGWIVTNAHVVADEMEISVTLFEKSAQHVIQKVELVAVNPYWDLALLRIPEKERAGRSFEPLPLADLARVEVGESVFAIGSPLGLERSVSEGIVSTKNRAHQGMLYVQTTTAINPGNSGGPLFNLRGEVVGVTTWGFLGTEGLNFAVPATTLVAFLDNREAFAFDKDQPNTGFRYLEPPRRGALGVR